MVVRISRRLRKGVIQEYSKLVFFRVYSLPLELSAWLVKLPAVEAIAELLHEVIEGEKLPHFVFGEGVGLDNTESTLGIFKRLEDQAERAAIFGCNVDG